MFDWIARWLAVSASPIPYVVDPATFPPGRCAVGSAWTPLTLVTKTNLSTDTHFYEFATPRGDPLQLATSAHVAARIPGTSHVRRYTPVSGPSLEGRFGLIVKSYDTGLGAHMAAMAVRDTLEFIHLPTMVSKQYPFTVGAVRAPPLVMVAGGAGITPAAACVLFGQRESRKLMIIGDEGQKMRFWKNSDLWTCVNPDLNTIYNLRLIPKREEPEVAVEPLSLLLYREKKCSEKYVSFSKVIAKAIKAAHAAAEQKPISIAAVLKKAEELEGCTVSIQGEDKKRLAFWKNSEFWDVVSKKAKSLHSIRLLPKSAAPAVGKRAASGAAEPAKKKRARK